MLTQQKFAVHASMSSSQADGPANPIGADMPSGEESGESGEDCWELEYDDWQTETDDFTKKLNAVRNGRAGVNAQRGNSSNLSQSKAIHVRFYMHLKNNKHTYK